jgi:hypothetical protein
VVEAPRPIPVRIIETPHAREPRTPALPAVALQARRALHPSVVPGSAVGSDCYRSGLPKIQAAEGKKFSSRIGG